MLPTLRGVFPQPKIQHKRDFLRENKRYLKDLQKISSRHSSQKEEEQQKLEELRRRQRHKSLDSRYILSQTRPSTCCSCTCQSKSNHQTTANSRPDSAAAKPEKVDTCNKEVQTDDIFDEEFLCQALKRCTPSEMMREQRNNEESEVDYTLERDRNSNENNLNFEDLSIETDRLPQTAQTASSVQLSTKRTARRIHELGDRNDVRLPRYLEREKREKEIQQQKERERDRNCPIGYEPISEEERQGALNTAERKFQALVNELNRMPMTTETLRIRTRKVEIERELVELENDIRIFSKPKVYVKANRF